MQTPSLRPRGVGQILEAAIKLYMANAGVLFAAAATVVVPLQLLAAIVLASIYANGQDISTSLLSVGHVVTPEVSRSRAGASAIVELDLAIATTLTLAACVKAISEAYLGRAISVGESLAFALRRLLSLLALEITYCLGLAVAFILLIIPGVWLYGAWSVAVPALLLEGLGPVAALGRSRRLVKGRWWPTAGVLLIGYLGAFVIGGTIEAILTGVFLAQNDPSVVFAVTITALAAILSGILVQPFVAAVITVLFHDLRLRAEGENDSFAGAEPGPEDVGRQGGPPFWPPPPGWRPGD
jgi:hypothetical protein